MPIIGKNVLESGEVVVNLAAFDTELTATTTFPSLSLVDLCKVQSEDHGIAKVKKWVLAGHKPTNDRLPKNQ